MDAVEDDLDLVFRARRRDQPALGDLVPELLHLVFGEIEVFQQDLDDPGLRKAKESYNPIGYMKKYLITITD